MREAGVDISAHRSKHVDELTGIDFDWVVTVCDHANESCPVLATDARRVHAGFDDPPRLAEDVNDLNEVLRGYRRVRDEIRAFVDDLVGRIEHERRPT